MFAFSLLFHLNTCYYREKKSVANFPLRICFPRDSPSRFSATLLYLLLKLPEKRQERGCLCFSATKVNLFLQLRRLCIDLSCTSFLLFSMSPKDNWGILLIGNFEAQICTILVYNISRISNR